MPSVYVPNIESGQGISEAVCKAVLTAVYSDGTHSASRFSLDCAESQAAVTSERELPPGHARCVLGA